MRLFCLLLLLLLVLGFLISAESKSLSAVPVAGARGQPPGRAGLQPAARALRAHVHDEARFLLYLGQDAEPAEDKGAPLFSLVQISIFRVAFNTQRMLNAKKVFALEGEHARHERRISARLSRRVRRGRTDKTAARQPDEAPREDGC